MPHRIFTGTFAALERRFLSEISARQNGAPLAPVVILVGSNVLASYLKYRVAEQGRAAANLRFLTFLDLAERLSAICATPGVKPRLPRLGAGVILDEVLRTGCPSVFARISAYAGFRASLLDTFRDLRDAGVNPEELRSAAGRLTKAHPDRKEHLEGLADLFRDFRQRASLFSDVDDDFRRAILNAGRAREFLGCDHLLLYGIYDVTGQQADLLRALRDPLELIYFIPYVGEQRSEFAAPFVGSRAAELGVRVERLVAASSDLDGRGLPTSAGTQLSLVLAPGQSRVAVEIVREILRALRDGIISGFHQAAVLLRHPEEEVPVLAEALRLRGIPFYQHAGEPYARRPLGQAVLALMALETDGFSRQAILRTMELTAAALPAASAELWDVPRWRALTNNPGFLSGLDSWDLGTETLIKKAWRALEHPMALPSDVIGEHMEGKRISQEQAERRLESARALQGRWRMLRNAASRRPAALSWRDWAVWLEQRLEPLLSESEDWPALAAILDELASLDEVAQVAGLKPATEREQVARALRESLSAFFLPQGRFQRNGVNILSLAAARGLRFPLVIVPGLEEGKFPARLRQDPLLLDEERRHVGAPARLPLKSERGKEERLLFDLAAGSAERRLVLMASRLDESSDSERTPSEFFLRAAGAARGETTGYRDLNTDVIPCLRSVRLDTPAPAEGEIAADEGEIRLRLVTSHSPGAPVLQALEELEPERLSGPMAFDSARWNRNLTVFDGRLRDRELARRLAAKLGGAAGQVSASRLEDYARCPYLFFLKRALELEKWEEVQEAEALDPMERGRLVHEILESFMKDFPGGRFFEVSVDLLRGSLETVARDRLERGRPDGMPDLLWEIERDRVLQLLNNWVEFERERSGEGFLPSSLERLFGDLSSATKSPAFRVQTPSHVFVFRGKIDRIDASRDGRRARVLDYKIGGLPESMARGLRIPLMGGEKLQLPVYRGALSLLPDFASVERVQGEYLYLQPKDGKILSCTLDPAMLDRALRALPEILEIAGESIEEGVFFARTSGTVRPNGHCDFCDYLLICGKDRVRREERKSGDPAVARFDRMRTLDEASVEIKE